MKRLLISAFFVAALVSLASAQDIVGDWQGPLTTASGELRIVLHVTKGADGTLKATLDSPDQAVGGIPVDSISSEGNKIRFVATVIKGNFEGGMKGANTISGNWTQGASTQKMQMVLTRTTTPLKMTHEPAAPSDIDGTWEGVYEVPTASVPEKKQVTFHIKNTADGQTATFDLPDAGAKGWPATEIERKGNSVKIHLKQFNVLAQVKLNKTLDKMTGDWIQGDDPARTLSIKKTQGPAADAPKADAAAPKQ
ncbi:MAG: hypothetical protein WAN03_13630 [Candidatus Sulfotelmatobacter sp.]